MTFKDTALGEAQRNFTGFVLIGAGASLALHGYSIHQPEIYTMGRDLVAAGLLALKLAPAQSAPLPPNTTTKTESVTVPPPETPPIP